MKSFVFIIPGYNNNKWINKCFQSIESNNYSKKRAIYIDDCSTEKINIPSVDFDITVIKNKLRCGPAYSRYIGIKQTKESEIIIFLDGDDWLAHDQVLAYLNKQYQNNDIKWTVSNYRRYINGKTELIPTIVNVPFKNELPCRSHLRSGYAWIWKNMPIKWIQFNGIFLKYMTDFNENLWAIKKVGQPIKLDAVLVIYNCDNTKTTDENNNIYKKLIKNNFTIK
jgi:glycosyltransferase involved in cell wall biosynthesis